MLVLTLLNNCKSTKVNVDISKWSMCMLEAGSFACFTLKQLNPVRFVMCKHRWRNIPLPVKLLNAGYIYIDYLNSTIAYSIFT